jgi:hypothetical protein
MKIQPLSLAAVLAAAVVAGCGGGGDDNAGSVTPLSVVPSDLSITGPKDACAGGPLSSSQVYVYGGAAPYRIDNPFPNYVTIDRTHVDSRGGYFTITFTGGCIDPGSIVVVDALDKQVTLTVHNTKGT